MAYVNYTPAGPKQMGPPSIGELRAGESPQRRFLNRLAAQGLTSRDARLRVMQCVSDSGKSRNDVAAVQVCIDEHKTSADYDDGGGVPRWALVAGASAVALGAVLLLRRK
jgi:hypothetical protein